MNLAHESSNMCAAVQAYKAGGHLDSEFVPLVLSLSTSLCASRYGGPP